MNRIKCTLRYDGSGFVGFQFQPGARTVGGELEKALKIMHKGEAIRIQSAGRTDAGVHALGQVIHFDSPFTIPENNWKEALNALLPEDIYIIACESVTEDFHARFSAIAKEYHYKILTTSEPDVFRRNYVTHFPWELKLDKMREACKRLEGTHDFTTFSSAKATVKGSRVRTLYHLNIVEKENQLTIIFHGNGFLYHMVRIIVSFLLDVGRRKREPEEAGDLIEARDRQQLGKTMGPQGLYLYKIYYQDE